MSTAERKILERHSLPQPVLTLELAERVNETAHSLPDTQSLSALLRWDEDYSMDLPEKQTPETWLQLMTEVTPDQRKHIKAILAAAQRAGIRDVGTLRNEAQTSALINRREIGNTRMAFAAIAFEQRTPTNQVQG